MNLIVEASMQTPVANTLNSGGLTTGTINPGIIWTGNFFQFGVEAIIPVNRQSGSNVGVIAQFHYLSRRPLPEELSASRCSANQRRQAGG